MSEIGWTKNTRLEDFLSKICYSQNYIPDKLTRIPIIDKLASRFEKLIVDHNWRDNCTWPESPSLCSRCNSLFTASGAVEKLVCDLSGEGLVFSRSFRELNAFKCTLCIVLLDSAAIQFTYRTKQTYFRMYSVPSHPEIWERGTLAPWKTTSAYDKQMVLKSLELCSSTPRDDPNSPLRWDHIRSILLTTHPEDPIASNIPTRPIQSHLNSDESYNLARKWLHECTDSGTHSDCQVTSSKILPTRVIDVRGIPKLHITKDNETNQYATLSYCWGVRAQSVMLLKENLDELCKGIPTQLLAKSIKDAISVVQKLQVPYLWIDSLCIIQDSKDDKKAEIRKMRSIYENSYITLAASSAKTCEEGFLEVQSPVVVLSKDSGRGVDSNVTGKFKRFPTIPIPFKCFDASGTALLQPYQGHDSHTEPINLRAWTLEEYMLSPRILTYGRSQILWDCNSSSKVNEGLRIAVTGMPFENLRKDFRENTSLEQKDAQTLQNYWYDVVFNYTSRKLTHPHDRLNAISGIASKLGDTSHRSYAYKAGLWQHDTDEMRLLRDLLWDEGSWRSRLENRLRWQPFERGRNPWPTWSWASIEGPIIYQRHHHPNDRSFSKVISCEIVLESSDDIYGPIEGGTLVIQGPMKEVRCKQKSGLLMMNDAIPLLQGLTDPKLDGRMDAVLTEELTMQAIRLTTLKGLFLFPVYCDQSDNLYRRIGIFDILPSRENIIEDFFAGCDIQEVKII